MKRGNRNSGNRWFALVVALMTCASLSLPMRHAMAAGEAAIKVVYHLSNGIDEAAKAMANIRNHLAADPTVKIVVVANGPGIDFLLDGATDKNGNPFDATVEDLTSQGVEFRICRNTMVARGIDPSHVLPEAQIVPSGVAEVARLQAKEDFAYIRP